jgi:hypothetical protein
MEQETVGDQDAPTGEIPSADHCAPELFRRWGLRTGRVVNGWTVASVDLDDEGAAVVASFSRGPVTVLARFARAGSKPHFARVGAIDITHDQVAPEFNAEVNILLKLVTEWLKRRGDAEALAASLAAGSPAPREERAQAPAPTNGAPAQPYMEVHEAPPLDPAKKAPPDRPVLDFEFIDAADVHRYPDALREIYRAERGGLVVRGVYSKEEMAEVVSRLESGQNDFPTMVLPPTQKSSFFGLCLEGNDPTLQSYLAAAERFREQTVKVFAGMEPFESRMERLFACLAGGRRVELARFTDGRAYTPATIRILPVGSQLATHCGNEMFLRPSYGHLNSIVDNYDQISYFLTLQEPEEGGELIIYDLKWAEVGPEHILPDQRSNVGSLLADSQWMAVRPSAGDVLMFDGGRWLHRVDWIKGSRTRWTMGGFMMFDPPGETLFYFA